MILSYMPYCSHQTATISHPIKSPLLFFKDRSSISLLFLLPILIMRFVIESGIFHEEHIWVQALVPTMRQTRAVAKTKSQTFCWVQVSPQKQRMTVATRTVISMVCEVENPNITNIDQLINGPEFMWLSLLRYNQHMNKLDAQKLSEDKKLAKELQPGQTIVLSAKLVKINHVNKKQERIILLTNKNLYNLLPSDTFLGLFSRIKRRIPYSNIIAMTVSRFGSEFVVHVEKEHDYRFSSPNLKLKIVETIVDCYCNFHKKKMALYYYDDLSLEQYTTTINDVDKNKKKVHTIDPLYLDSQSIKQNEQVKAESKLIFKNETNVDNISTFEEFQLLKVLGRGAFGKVMLCQNKKNNKYYAIKSMRKEDLIEKEHLTKTKTERYLLQKAKHPFLVSLEFAFQTKEKIFFVMDFIRGGEMFTHLRKCKKFTEKRAKFYAAQVFLAVQYLHDLGFVYRDLKPENILFETDGYLKVSDYGLAKELKPGEKTYSLAGTPDYVSPQIITSKGQTFMTDWWAFGILIYEMVYGSPPFYNRDHEKMFQDIVNRELFFDSSKTDVSDHCKNIIYSLLKKDPAKRIGAKDQNQIKNHPWFADMNWSMLLAKKIKPDFIPVVGTEIDVTNFDETFTKQEPINSLVSTDMLLLSKFEKEFAGIDFYGEEKKQEEQSPTPNPSSQLNFAKKKP